MTYRKYPIGVTKMEMVVNVKKPRSWSSRHGKNGNTSTKRTLTCASREINSKWSKMRGYLGFMLIISSPGWPIYKIYTTRLPKNSVQDKTIPSIQSKENILQQLHSIPHGLLQHTMGQCNNIRSHLQTPKKCCQNNNRLWIPGWGLHVIHCWNS